MTTIESETHRRLLTLLERGLADQDTLGQRLTPDERSARGELTAWSAKDHVAHNNFWRRDAMSRLQAALDGSTPRELESDDVENDRVFQQQRETLWDELVSDTRMLRTDSAALIRQHSTEDLSTRNRYPWQQGDSLETLILVNWYDHPAEHWADFYLRRQEVGHAVDLRQAVARTVQELFPHEPKLYSYMAYKLGVVYAKTGRTEDAIRAIRDALTANPSLIESVRQDTDFDALHAVPDFQRMVS